MSGTDDQDRDLEAFAERLDRAFAATKPSAGFRADLWQRLPRRRFAVPRFDATQLAGIAAAFIIVLGAGYLLTHISHGGGGGASTSSYHSGGGAPANAPRADSGVAQSKAAAARAFGALPRPQVAPGATAAQAGGKVTASLALPPTAAVVRYAEPTAADADGFASTVSAHRAATLNPADAQVYAGSGFSLSIFPTNAPQGLLPSFVLTPQSSEPNGSGPDAATAQDAAQRFLQRFSIQAPMPNRVDIRVTPNAPTVVRYISLVQGYDQVATDGTPVGLSVVVKADGSVFQANGPLPLTVTSSEYPLAPFADLARTAASATSATLDRAVLVYVLAFDGQYGYIEPAVLFTGGGKNVLVPAVDPSLLRR